MHDASKLDNLENIDIVVLIVEDDTGSSSAYERQLLQHPLLKCNKHINVRIYKAFSKEDIKIKYQDINFDIIITDLDLSAWDIQGEDVIKLFKSKLDIDVQILIISGYNNRLIAIKKTLPTACVILKPYNQNDFNLQMGEVLSHAIEKLRNIKYYYMLRTSLSLINNLMVGVVIVNKEGNINYVNKAFEYMTGYDNCELVGSNPRILKGDDKSPEFYKQFWCDLLEHRERKVVFLNRHKDGHLYYQQTVITPHVNEAGDISHFVGVAYDITEDRTRDLEIASIIESLTETVMIFNSKYELIKLFPESPDTITYSLECMLSIEGKSLNQLKLLNKDHEMYIKQLFSNAFKAIDGGENVITQEIEAFASSKKNAPARILSVTAKRFNSSKFIVTMHDVTDALLVSQVQKFTKQIELLNKQNLKIFNKYKIK